MMTTFSLILCFIPQRRGSLCEVWEFCVLGVCPYDNMGFHVVIWRHRCRTCNCLGCIVCGYVCLMFDVYVWRVLILDVSRETAPAWAAIISNKHWADSRDTISAQIQDDSTANKHDRDAPNTCRFFPLLCATKNYLSDRYKMNKFTLLISLRLTSTYIPQRTCIHLSWLFWSS